MLGKMRQTWKNAPHLKKNASHFKKMRQTWKNAPHFKKMRQTWKNAPHFKKCATVGNTRHTRKSSPHL